MFKDKKNLVVFLLLCLLALSMEVMYFDTLYNISLIFMSLFLLIVTMGVFLSGMYAGRTWDIPYITKRNEWTIGIYAGDSPLNIAPSKDAINPVLTAKNVTDVPANFVADPFMIKKDSKCFMFFEVMNAKTQRGDIGLAVSDNGLKWTYKQIVISEPFHLSYPYVFEWGSEYYMIPESSEAYSVRLYKAIDFPLTWLFTGNLLYGRSFKDSSLFRYNDMWWMFTTDRNDYLLLYYSENMTGPWIEHPASPVVRGDNNAARPGGRAIVFDDQIIRYVQKGTPASGFVVLAYEVTELTISTYSEKPAKGNPVLKAGSDKWIKKGGHNIDVHRIEKDKWIAYVDGFRERITIGLKY